MFSLGVNLLSLRISRQLEASSNQATLSTERLGSGFRINRASDDAAGLAIASTLNAQSRIFTVGIRNANDVISAFSIADGSLQQLSGITTRLKELTIQSMNGTFSQTQRASLDREAQALRLEYNRLVDTTSFNDIQILKGGFSDFSAQVGGTHIDHLSIDLGGTPGNYGTGTFAAEIVGDGERAAGSIAFADIDNDGDQDAIETHQALNQVIVYKNDGAGNLSAFQTLSGITSPRDIALGDVDGDGDADMVYSFNNSIGVRLNNGSGTFGAATNTVLAGAVLGIELFDFTGDGRPDIVAQSEGASLRVLSNNGSGVFSVSQTLAGGGGSIARADFNGDGYTDIVSVGSGSTNGYLYAGGAGGTFSAGAAFALGNSSYTATTYWNEIIAGDFNGDGRADIIFAREGANASDLYMKTGDGSGGFNAATLIDTFAGHGLSAADYDGDGDLDFASGESSKLYENNGTGSFATTDYSAVAYTGGQPPRATGFTDMNKDGVLDFIVANSDGATAYGTSVFLQDTEIRGRDLSIFPTLTLLTADGRAQALTDIEDVRSAIISALSRLGAYQSRIDTTINNLQVARENFKAAASRIQDIDVAEESAKYVQATIRQQVAASIMAQANQAPALAIQLLRGS